MVGQEGLRQFERKNSILGLATKQSYHPESHCRNENQVDLGIGFIVFPGARLFDLALAWGFGTRSTQPPQKRFPSVAFGGHRC